MSKIGIVIALAVAALLVASSSASGAVVRTSEFSERTVKIDAGPGEENDLSVSRSDNPDVVEIEVVENGSAPLTAGPGCSETATSVLCVVQGNPIVSAELDDGSDRFDAAAFPGQLAVFVDLGHGNDELNAPVPSFVEVNAGPGDDLITLNPEPAPSGGFFTYVYGMEGSDLIIGGDGNDHLEGGPGNDRIRGKAGRDYVLGEIGRDKLILGLGDDEVLSGPGDDLVLGGGGGDQFKSGQKGDDVLMGQGGEDFFESFDYYGGPKDGNDRLLGGDGRDFVHMQCRTCSVSLDGLANDGRPGERDNAFVENVWLEGAYEDDEGTSPLGPGINRVVGDASGNWIRTYFGPDTIDGKGGEDDIEAGDGDDTIRSVDGEVDDIDCGPGVDIVEADEIDVLTSCETVRFRPREAS